MAVTRNHINLLLFMGLALSCEANFFFRLRGDAEKRGQDTSCVMPRFEDADILPLKSSHTSALLSGSIADVSILQTYSNEGNVTIRSAKYVFPASSRAAVYHMEAKYGEKVVRAVVKPRDEAQHEYNDAISSGRQATLLQQHRPNVFEMNVGNICPGDVVEVTLKYTETLVLDDQTYSFMVPGVVGPRYTGEEISNDDERLPGIQHSSAKEGTFEATVTATVDAGVAVKSLTSPTHKIVGAHRGGYAVDVTFSEHEMNPANRDFVLEYSLSGSEPQAGFLLHSDEGKGERFFQLNVQPQSLEAIDAADATALPPREYVFIVDVSGSMHGSPLETAKTLMKQLLSSLRADVDLFNVVLFDWSPAVLSESTSLPPTPENINAALSLLGGMAGGGGTNLLQALQRSFQLPRNGAISRTSVVITDGYVSIEDQAFSLVRDHVVSGGENVFAFGIGQSVNRYLIEGLGRAGLSDSYVLLDESSASDAVAYLQDYLRTPVLTDVKIRLPDGVGAMSVVPSKAGAMLDFAPGALIPAPDVFARKPLILVGKVMGEILPGAVVEVSGVSSSNGERTLLRVPVDAKSQRNLSVMYLWARSIVDDLQASTGLLTAADTKAEVVRIGMRYNLLTQHTSFLAVNDGPPRACSSGSTVDVTQPLPLPAGLDIERSGVSMAKTPPKLKKMAQRASVTAGAANVATFGAPEAMRGKELVMEAPIAPADGGYEIGSVDDMDTVDMVIEEDDAGLGQESHRPADGPTPGPTPSSTPSPYAAAPKRTETSPSAPSPNVLPDGEEGEGTGLSRLGIHYVSTTLTTVGYGDTEPRSYVVSAGCVVVSVALVVGVLLAAVNIIRRRRPAVSCPSAREALTSPARDYTQ